MIKSKFRNIVLNYVVVAVLCLLFASSSLADEKQSTRIEFPEAGIGVDNSAVLLAIDEVSLPLRQNLCYFITKPKVRLKPVLEPNRSNPNAPDHLAAHFYGTVLLDNGKYRMWYYPVSYVDKEKDPSHLAQGPVCYAESDDGISWRRPNLGQVEYMGSRNNNAIALPYDRIEGVHVIKDVDDPDPARLYKMVYNPNVHETSVSFGIGLAVSSDGIHWTPIEQPSKQFFEQASFYKHNGYYFIHGQEAELSEGGHPGGRQGYAWMSRDFDHWLRATAPAFKLTEPTDPKQRGLVKPYDQVHLGVGGYSLGNVVIGMYGLWHNRPGDKDPKVRANWFGFNATSCDLGLVVSNDGIHFREPVKGHAFIHRKDSPVTPAKSGKPATTVLIQSNGILNVGDETRIYHGRWRNSPYGEDYWGEVALATIPRDRWGAIGLFPKRDEGEVWSTPIVLPANCELTLNADRADLLTVELMDDQLQSIVGWSGEAAGRSKTESGLNCPVVWANSKLADLAGQKVRLRIRFRRDGEASPRLFAINMTSRFK